MDLYGLVWMVWIEFQLLVAHSNCWGFISMIVDPRVTTDLNHVVGLAQVAQQIPKKRWTFPFKQSAKSPTKQTQVTQVYKNIIM